MTTLCAHLRPGPYPFEVELVIDDYMGMTDGIVRCRQCDRLYLLELVDWAGTATRERLFRAAVVDRNVFERYAHDVSRDYCDLTRKGAELHSLHVASVPADRLILLETHERRVIETRLVPADLPTGSWRQRLYADSVIHS